MLDSESGKLDISKILTQNNIITNQQENLN